MPCFVVHGILRSERKTHKKANLIQGSSIENLPSATELVRGRPPSDVRLSINDLALVDGPPVEVDEPGRAARLIALGLRGGVSTSCPRSWRSSMAPAGRSRGARHETAARRFCGISIPHSLKPANRKCRFTTCFANGIRICKSVDAWPPRAI